MRASDRDGALGLGGFLRAQARFLSFRDPRLAPEQRGAALCGGLLVTWLVGVGRYWDHPSAHWWQYAGLGSVAYVFVLAALLWLVALPLGPRGWAYRNVLLFVTLTSAPALLYAIPVERFMTLTAATELNYWFLVVVAGWRVALLLRQLAVAGGLGWGWSAVTALLPLALVVMVLAALNLEHATFELMAMPDAAAATPNDAAYEAIWVLSLLAYVLGIPLLLFYLIGIGLRSGTRRREAELAAQDPGGAGIPGAE